jgi:hypothetical protein
MKLPNGEAAFIDLAKLRDYSLSAMHPEGKHKARVFFARPRDRCQPRRLAARSAAGRRSWRRL